jgi:hypothetical protein
VARLPDVSAYKVGREAARAAAHCGVAVLPAVVLNKRRVLLGSLAEQCILQLATEHGLEIPPALQAIADKEDHTDIVTLSDEQATALTTHLLPQCVAIRPTAMGPGQAAETREPPPAAPMKLVRNASRTDAIKKALVVATAERKKRVTKASKRTAASRGGGSAKQ